MFKTMNEIKDIADCIPGYTAVYKIGDGVERLYNSENFAELLGLTKEELQNKPSNPLDLIYKEDIDTVQAKMYAAVKKHEKIDLKYRFVHKSGMVKWASLHGNYVGDMDGDAIYLVNIFDASDEWTLRDTILDSSTRGVVVFDRDSKTVLYGNDKFFKFADTTKEACLGRPCYEVVCRSGIYDKATCICFQAIGRTEPMITHNEVNDTYFEISASEITWGEHPAIIFYTSDITAATKKDLEIAEKNEKLRQIQDDAIRAYKKQLELITDGSSDVLSTCRFNLTKNTCIPGTATTELMRELQSCGTADGYFSIGRARMDPEDLKVLENYPSVETLLTAFDNGVETISGDGYFKVDDEKSLYVRTTVHMAQNPVTQDIEAVLYTRDLTGTKLRNDIMRCLMEKQYESISVISLKNSKVSVFSYSYDNVAGSQYDGEDYDVCRTFFTDTYVAEQDRENYRKCSNLEYIRSKLDTDGSFALMFHFNTETDDEPLKAIEYYYSDDRRHTIIGATRDITDITKEQKKNMDDLKEALLRADKATEAKSAFFSNISHDMRTPLNGILGFSGLGKEAQSLDEANTYFEKIHSSGEFLLKLINDTLDISKIESGQMGLKLSNVRLDEILQETVNAVEETARAKNINFVVQHPTDTHKYVSTDKLRLEQLLTNLLGNAIKFTPSGGTIKFIVKELAKPKHKCNYKITIQDNGSGMKEEFIPHAFEAYSQDETTSPVKGTGTGLGLAIVKQIVTLMKGEITLESEDGKGTRFDIWLPLEVVAAKREEKADIRDIDLNGKHVLMCEDHPINRELACRLLERKGVKITCAENGKVGVQAFADSKVGEFDAILMDIRMPEMNGLEAAEAIRHLDRNDAKTIPIIAMTANAYESDKKAAIRFGMNAHLPKPIEPKALYQTLHDYINSTTHYIDDTDGQWKPKVIVVDDIAANVAAIKAALEHEYTVYEASDGLTALKTLEKEAGIAAVITDIQMPNMDGTKLIKAIRNNHEYDHVAILANTQYGEPSQQETLLAMGADDFIYKPTVVPVVLTRLENVLRKRKQDYK